MKTIILDKDAFRHYSPKELHPHFKQFDQLLESVIGNDPRCKAYVDFPLGISILDNNFPLSVWWSYTGIVHGTYHSEYINDPDMSEYFVPVEWLQTVPVEQAIKEVGMFGNQNTVCRPTTPKWRWTIERLKERFQMWLE